MTSIKWVEPVSVAAGAQEIRVVSGPSEALACLSEAWPDARGPRYVAARSICRAAIDGRKPVEDARNLFLLAAHEAKLHAH
ncbi:DUF982 domain-containing protein [Rhizobium sp. CC-YZS058]|uniref:DUF982 domain-containing protein n=1 Tax=Rhizobium sp. CC-YZS058 TaxID=3042153 RepID=UPI002B051B81|nr:DUF982 domain-containing protein [Rhizobium sp. CC-YZS058]MEA3534667.1 DUF982 domain-containing protein [Rhizobium sp. CC-YZS058]